jgi:glycosyltransferase involved in cell wall biosynthesis
VEFCRTLSQRDRDPIDNGYEAVAFDVSVILPFFNSAAWIGEAVRSVTALNKLRIEIIAVDDGSTDDSAQVAARASQVPIRILRNSSNVGTAQSLNRGIEASEGIFIARMDADDICLPDRFVRQANPLFNTGCDICGTWVREIGRGLPRKLKYPVGEEAVHVALLFQNSVCHPTLMARREVFERFQYSNGFRVAQDYDLLSRMSSEFRIDNIPSVLLRYRRHRAQATLAKRELVTSMANRIRADTLARRGLRPTPNEVRLHNLIRSPYSIGDVEDLRGIETWLLKLCNAADSAAAKRVIAKQWVFACVRAAILGGKMWAIYRRSDLRGLSKTPVAVDTNLYALSKLRLKYGSAFFDALTRLRIGI